MKQIKKRYLILASVALIVIVFLFFLSTLVKNYVVDHSKELIGRKVEINNIHFNYWKLAVRVNDVVVFEKDDAKQFAGFKELYVDFSPWKLLGNEYSLSQITLDSLFVYVEMDGDAFNFDDMIPADDTAQVAEVDTMASDVRYSIYNIDFKRGKVEFFDKQVNNRLKFDDMNLNLPLIAWDNRQSEMGIQFEFGSDGRVSINGQYDVPSEKYTVDVDLQNLDLAPFTNYVKPYLAIDSMAGSLYSKIKVVGSSTDVTNIVVMGQSNINRFSLTDANGAPLATFEEATAVFDSLDLGKMSFKMGRIVAKNPVLHVALNKDMSNWERALIPYFTADSLAMAAVDSTAMAVDSSSVSYLIDSVIVQNGRIAFADNTLNRPFVYDFKELEVVMAHLSDAGTAIPLDFKINMNDQGRASGKMLLNMVDPFDITVDAMVQKLGLLSFSPYSEYFIARPITQGDFNYKLSIDMTSQLMTSQNIFNVSELEFGEKTRDTTAIGAPVRLGLYLLKDPNDVIAIDLPVSGNPSDPDFRVGKIIWKALMNLLVKTAASPFNALGSLVGTRPEDLENMPMLYAQDTLAQAQINTLTKIADILKKKPDLKFSFRQQTHPEDEKLALAAHLVKQQYLKSQMPLANAADSAAFRLRMNELTVGDEVFKAYVNARSKMDASTPIHLQCKQILGSQLVDEPFAALLEKRNALIVSYLIEQLTVDAGSIEVSTADLRNLPEELKSPNFKVEVSLK